MIYAEVVKFTTERKFEIIDITARVKRAVEAAGIKNGQVLIFSRHSTCSIIINENEKGLLYDLERFLRDITAHQDCRHDNLRRRGLDNDEQKNGKSHLMSALLGPSQVVPIIKGKLLLGKWQQILVVETSGPREREVVIQILGNRRKR